MGHVCIMNDSYSLYYCSIFHAFFIHSFSLSRSISLCFYFSSLVRFTLTFHDNCLPNEAPAVFVLQVTQKSTIHHDVKKATKYKRYFTFEKIQKNSHA